MPIKSKASTAAQSTIISTPGDIYVPDYSIRPPRRRARTCLYGYGGCGKTTYVTLFAPDPIKLLNYDKRAEDAVYLAQTKYKRRIDKAVIGFPGNILRVSGEASQRIAQQALGETFRHFDGALREAEKGNLKTIAFDTGTELDMIMSVAAKGLIGEPKKDFGKSKGLMNRQWLSMFLDASNSGAHMIVLARASEIWSNNEPTGRYSPKISDTALDAADWAGEIRTKPVFETDKKGKKVRAGTTWEIEITKAGNSWELAELGSIYTQVQWEDFGGPFVYSNMMQYEGSTMEDWE